MLLCVNLAVVGFDFSDGNLSILLVIALQPELLCLCVQREPILNDGSGRWDDSAAAAFLNQMVI